MSPFTSLLVMLVQKFMGNFWQKISWKYANFKQEFCVKKLRLLETVKDFNNEVGPHC